QVHSLYTIYPNAQNTLSNPILRFAGINYVIERDDS
ncbi:MAG: hypothetical protein ACJATP_002630, partial [Candidatus Azotimanducaceae bacterium]